MVARYISVDPSVARGSGVGRRQPQAGILTYAAAAFLTALVANLLVVAEEILKPLVIAILVPGI